MRIISSKPVPNAAARLRLNRRLDAAITVIQASRDRVLLARLATEARIVEKTHPSIALIAIYQKLLQTNG